MVGREGVGVGGGGNPAPHRRAAVCVFLEVNDVCLQ